MGKLQHGEECGLVIGAKAATMAAKVALDLASSTHLERKESEGRQPLASRGGVVGHSGVVGQAQGWGVRAEIDRLERAFGGARAATRRPVGQVRGIARTHRCSGTSGGWRVGVGAGSMSTCSSLATLKRKS